MALRIQTSTSLQLINRGVSRAQSDLRVSLRRLATGLRINGASDDAAGLAISERLNARVRGALMTIQNLNMGASAVQVIEGALGQSERALMRMRELSVAAASETLNAQDRDALNAEFKLLSAHLDAIAEQTHYNGIRLLDGQHQQLQLQVGGERGDTFQVKLAHVSARELGRQARYTTQRRGVFAGPAATGDLKLNGVAIRGTEPTDDDISYSFSSGSSIAKAAAINAATQFTGVRAIVEHNSFTGFEPIRAVDLSPQRFFKINGFAVTAVNVEAKDATGDLIEAINAGYEETGVVADVDSDGRLILTAEDGRNITVEYGDATVRDAIRMIDDNGDPLNLVDTVDPVQYDLDGDIADVSFAGTGTYDGAHSIVGDVTIVGATSADATGGYERPRDNVDYVLEVVNPGELGTATFRFKEQSIGDYVNDDDPADVPEDYLFNAKGVVTSANGSKVSITGDSFYNEASNRTFTLNVTKNGLPSAADPSDLPEFTVTMVNQNEASDTSVSGPFVADQGTPVDIGYGISIDFPVDDKEALRPNGTTLNTGQDITRTALAAGDSYNDHPQFRTWTGDRTTYFTYEVLSTGHVAGNLAPAGANTQAAQIQITAETPSLALTESTVVTLNPAGTQNVTYKGMTVRFTRQKGSTNASSAVIGSYAGNFRANDSDYVGTEKRKYEVELLETGKITNTSALDARVTVKDSVGNTLQTYVINDVRSGAEFDLGTGVHFEGARADFTASQSSVGNPSVNNGAPAIATKVDNTYNGASDKIGVIEVVNAGRLGGGARYQYYYQDDPGTIIDGDPVNGDQLSVGRLTLSDGLKIDFADTPGPDFSVFNDNGLAMTRDASGYTEERDATFTGLVRTDINGDLELVVDWSFDDGDSAQEVIELNGLAYIGNAINIGSDVTVTFQAEVFDGEGFSGAVEPNDLEVGQRWTVGLTSGAAQAGSVFTVNATPRTLAAGTKWEVTGEVPMWEVGDQYTVTAQHNFNDQLATLNSEINLADPNTGAPIMGTVKLTGNGTFNTGDEVRIRTRGFTGTVTSSGLYTDNLYPTNYIVTITQAGEIGTARYDWVREDGRTETQNNGSGTNQLTSAGATLLEEGVFIAFSDNGSGDSYLAVGDQFIIPVGQKLEYTFAGGITLQSDDNINIEHVDVDDVNQFGRLIYGGDTPNEAGTEGNLLTGPLGQNVADSVDTLSLRSQVSAEEAIDTIDEAIDQINAARVSAGAALNRIARMITSEQTVVYETESARSRIRDADIAAEMSEFMRVQTRRGAAPLLAQIARLELERSLLLINSTRL